jgi:hypothetical protein
MGFRLPIAALLGLAALSLAPFGAAADPGASSPASMDPDADRLPAVRAIEPGNGSQDVPVSVRIVILFTEPMEPRSVEAAFSLAPARDADLSWSNSSNLIVVPDGGLAHATSYTVRVAASASSAKGETIGTDFTSGFATASDSSAPMVAWSVPENGGGHPASARLVVAFSEPMNRSSVEAAVSFTGGVAGFDWFGSSLVVRSGPTAPGSAHTLSINGTAKDASGNPIGGLTTIGFTAGASDLTRPSLWVSDPPSGATRVPLGVTLMMSFSEPVIVAGVSLSPAPAAGYGISRASGWTKLVADPRTVLAEKTPYMLSAGGVMDLSGNAAGAVGVEFTTADITAPKLVSSGVDFGGKDRRVEDDFTFEFSEPLSADTLDAGIQFWPRIKADPDVQGSTVRYHLLEPLAFGQAYTLNFTSNLTDLEGNPLSPENRTHFTAYALPTASALPRHRASNIDIRPLIQVTFSRSMDPVSVEKALRMEPRFDHTLEWANANSTLTLRLGDKEVLRYSTAYTIEINKSAQDVNGFSLDRTRTFTWNTRAPPIEVTPLDPILVLSIVLIPFLFIILAYSRRHAARMAAGKRSVGRRPESVQAKGIAWIESRLFFPSYLSPQKIQIAIHRQMPTTHVDRYRLKTIWLWYPFYCLGGISFIAFIILAITGVFLGFYYVPDGTVIVGGPNNGKSLAYLSMEVLMRDVPFGYVMRAVHHWAAHAMIASVFLHMMRVYFVGAYKKPREFNWVLGTVLLGVTLGFGYTGYLLPWDQLGYWAGTIGLEMARSIPLVGDSAAGIVFGGTALSGATVTRMYYLHVYILPLLGGALMILHMVIVYIQGLAEPH